MKKSLMTVWMILGLLSAVHVVGSAQGRPPGRGKDWEPRSGPPPEQNGDRHGPPDWQRPPGGDIRGPGPSFEMFSDRKVVKGAPYAATAVTESVQTLADGAKVTNKKSETVYRDSEGRTRRELTFDRVGPFSVGDQPQQLIFINDVVAGVNYVLDPSRKTVRKMPNFDRPAPNFPPPAARQSDERKTDTLGKQALEGVDAEGSRTTTTIPAGKIGNDRALEIVSERWESPTLGVVVLSKHKDPFAGETTYRLTNIKLNEPAHTLFEVPSDYTIEDAPRGPAPRGPSFRGDNRKPPQEDREELR